MILGGFDYTVSRKSYTVFYSRKPTWMNDGFLSFFAMLSGCYKGCWGYIENYSGDRLFVNLISHQVEVDSTYGHGDQYLWRFQEEGQGYLIENKAIGIFQEEDVPLLSHPLGWSFIPSEENPSQWMEALPDRLTLKDICLPGTHHSAMYQANPGFLECNPALLQKIDVYQQLMQGVRFLHLAVCYLQGVSGSKQQPAGFYCYHKDTIGPSLGEVLSQVAGFYRSAAAGRAGCEVTGKEVVILCLTGFKDLDEDQNHQLVAFIEEKLSNLLLEKNMVGWGNLGKLPLAKLRSKVIVLFKEKPEQQLCFPYAIRRNIYEWGRDLVIDMEENVYGDFSEMESKHLRKLLLFDDPERLLLIQWTLPDNASTANPMPDYQEYLTEVFPGGQQNEIDNIQQRYASSRTIREKNAVIINHLLYLRQKQAICYPLFSLNRRKQKVNIILQDFVENTRLLTSCRYSNCADVRKPTFGTNVQHEKKYRIRPLWNMNLCVQLSPDPLARQQIEISATLLPLVNAAPISLQQVFTFTANGIGQARGAFAANHLDALCLLGANEQHRVIFTTLHHDRLSTEWILEPYFQPVFSKKRKIIRYQRQTACYLLVHAASKLCLSYDNKEGRNMSLVLYPYNKDKDNLQSIWFFEEIYDAL